MGLFSFLFSDAFMSHGHCYLWQPGLVWTHVTSDALIGLSYASIPFTLVHIVRSRKDLPFNWMFLCFGMFIAACGATHVMEIYTVWEPRYWLSAAVKVITAMASVPTALLLIRLAPRAIALPSQDDLQRAKNALQVAHDELERRVELRTAELAEASEALGIEMAERRRSESHYSTLVKNATHGIFTSSREGWLIDANPAMVEMLGYESEQELLQVQVPLPEAGFDSRITGTDVAWSRRDGKQVRVRLSGRLVSSPDRGGKFFEGIAEDLTERELLEKQVRELQKFDAIGQLAGAIAHDFNNLLGGILGTAEMARTRLSEQDSTAPALDRILEQSKKAAGLTQQLLAFARKQILERHPLDLNQVAEESLGLLESVIGADIEVQTKFAGGLSAVEADSTHMEQVVVNLVLNARDAMPKGGRLTLTTEEVELDDDFCRLNLLVTPGRHVKLSVSDTGVGIAPEIAERIFEPFFTTKEIGKGTGLGLATVYGIVKQHGGFVQVESEVGRGATFHVVLPVSTGEARVPARTTGAGLTRGTETILLADDNDTIRSMAEAALEMGGYKALLATNGQEAVEMFKQHRNEVALVVMDLVMPKMSGLDAFAQILKIRPNVPVIFVTGYSAEMHLVERFDVASKTVMQKPYSPRALLDKIREFLDRPAERTN